MNERWRIAGVAVLALAASGGIAAAVVFTAEPPGEPRDGRAWILEARQKMDADRFEEAVRAYENGIAASRKVAGDAQVWCELADAVGMAQGGRLQGRPAELVQRALAINGTHPRCLEMAGSAAYEAADYPRARLYWEQLLVQLTPGTREHGELSAAIARTRSM